MNNCILVASGPCLENIVTRFKSVWPCMSPTSVSMMRPIKKEKRLTPKRKSSLRCLRLNTVGCMSTIAVTRLSTHTNWWDRSGRKLCATVSGKIWPAEVTWTPSWRRRRSRRVCLHTWLSSPRNTIMMKKSAAHRVEKGIMLTARG